MKSKSTPSSGSDRQDTAEYISVMTAKLAKLARSHDHRFLAHILDVAGLEAKEAAGQAAKPRRRASKSGVDQSAV